VIEMLIAKPKHTMPRVVHAIAPATLGGAERVVYLLAAALWRRAQSCSVVALLDPTGPEPWLVQALRSNGIPIFPVRARRRGYLTEIRQMAAVVRRCRADILHCHGYRADVLGLAAAHRTRTPLVTTAHGFTSGGRKNRFFEWIDRQCLRRVQGVIAVSAALERQLLDVGVLRSRLWHIPNASPVPETRSREQSREVLGITPHVKAIGWIGRISREKGPDVLLRAVKRMHRSDLHAVMIGDGPWIGATKQLASDLGLSSSVHFAGAVSEAANLMKAFDVFVLSSHSEGLPIVLLEAMGAGVPIVASAVGEIPNVLDHGRLGLLTSPGDPDGLADALLSVLRDASAATDRAVLAQRYVADRYAIDPWIESILEVYESVIRQFQKP